MAQYLDKTGLTTLWAKIKNTFALKSHTHSKSEVGLGNVNNTSDADKPVSNATQQALNLKANANDVYTKSETDNKINEPLYNLGHYDTITENSDGTYTITRQTGYTTIEGSNILSTFTSGGSKVFCAETNIILPNAVTDWNQEFGTSNIGYKVVSVDGNWIFNKSIGGIGGQSVKIANNDFTTIDQFKSLCPINIQYKMTTSYTEKVEKNHYATYNQRFILEHNKNEAERSANLFDDNGTNSIQYIGHYYTDDSVYNYNISPNDNYNCFRIRVEQNKTYYIKRSDGLILRFEDINNNLIGGLSFVDIGYGRFTTPNGCKYVVFSKNISLATNVTMLNEGTTPLPYQPYEGKVVHEKDLDNYVTTDTSQEISNTKYFTKGLKVSGRYHEQGDDEGVIVAPDSNGNAVVCLGFATWKRSALIFYTDSSSSDAFWRFNDGVGSNCDIFHPKKSGTIALTSDFKTINGNSIVGSGDMAITADSVFTEVTDVIDTFTINRNGTWLITCLGYNKIYASDNSSIFFYGSALVSMTSAGSDPHICINGTAYACSSAITFITSGIMQVYKKAN